MLAVFLLAAISSLFLFWWFSIPKREKTLPRIKFDDPAACAMIIACIGYDCSGDRNIISKVESRSHPNQRLVRTFGIDNDFTTINEKYRRDFRNHT